MARYRAVRYIPNCLHLPLDHKKVSLDNIDFQLLIQYVDSSTEIIPDSQLPQKVVSLPSLPVCPHRLKHYINEVGGRAEHYLQNPVVD